MFGINYSTKEVSIKKNMTYNSIGNLIYGVSQWALVAIITIISGYEAAGILSLASSIVAVIYTISLYGMRIYQATDIAYQFDDADYAISRFITALISIAICIIYLLVFTNYNFEKCSVIFAYMIYKCMEAVCDVFHGMMQRKKRMDIIGISVTIRAILIVLTFTIALLLGFSLFIACISMAVSTLLVFLLFDIPNTYVICSFKYRYCTPKQIKLLKICFPLMLAGVINNAVMAIPKISLEAIMSSEILGIFTILSVPTLFISSMAAYLLSPIAVEFGECIHNNNINRFMHLIKISILAIIGVTIIATVFAYFLGDFCLKLVYRHDMGIYVPQFTILMIISGLYALITLMGNVFTSIRWLYFMLFMHATVLIITYIVSPILIKWQGLWGAVWATGLSAIVYVIINYIGIIFVRRKFRNV